MAMNYVLIALACVLGLLLLASLLAVMFSAIVFAKKQSSKAAYVVCAAVVLKVLLFLIGSTLPLAISILNVSMETKAHVIHVISISGAVIGYCVLIMLGVGLWFLAHNHKQINNSHEPS